MLTHFILLPPAFRQASSGGGLCHASSTRDFGEFSRIAQAEGSVERMGEGEMVKIFFRD